MNWNLGVLNLFDEVEGGVAITPENLVILIVATLFLLIVSYLLGSINSAVMVSRLLFHDDVRNYGSHNAGLTNVMRTFGKKAAVLTLAGDMLKMALSLLLAGFLFGFEYAGLVSWNPLCYLGGLFCVIGHVKPIFFRFKGGKGVLSFATMALILTPIPFLIMFVLFVGLVLLTKFISLGSIMSAALYPLTVQTTMQVIINNENYEPFVVIICFVASMIVIFCHRENIKRLINRTENKFSFHPKTVTGETESDKKHDRV